MTGYPPANYQRNRISNPSFQTSATNTDPQIYSQASHGPGQLQFPDAIPTMNIRHPSEGEYLSHMQTTPHYPPANHRHQYYSPSTTSPNLFNPENAHEYAERLPCTRGVTHDEPPSTSSDVVDPR
ncbi:MAG: hypothetical protein LQ352_003822 [Teloschistes flavicans]|nr:MAG: hypothetical protein LQ352_003822 [Teloschistes flavicans]